MSQPPARADLAVLAADRNTEAALKGLLGRPQALGIRPITWKTYVHQERDPGVFRQAAEFLRPLQDQYTHALVLFDRHGCGREGMTAEDLETDLESRLRTSGWADRAAAICLDPELEVWVWSSSPEVAAALGWEGRAAELRSWLEAQGLWRPHEPKPHAPEEAVEKALWEKRVPRSSAIYERLAQRVGVRRCTDRAFRKLKAVLQRWFFAGSTEPQDHLENTRGTGEGERA